jgi:hypothetical protein
MTGKRTPIAKQVDIATADDARHSFLRFKTVDGEIRVGLTNKDLSRLAALLINQSEKVSHAKIAEDARTGHTQRRANLTVLPIRASAIGIAPGLTDGEVFLTMEVGNMALCFATSEATLQDVCRDLQHLDRAGKPKRPN